MMEHLINMLLDDDHGLSTEAFTALVEYVDAADISAEERTRLHSILECCNVQDDRWHLPEGGVEL